MVTWERPSGRVASPAWWPGRPETPDPPPARETTPVRDAEGPRVHDRGPRHKTPGVTPGQQLAHPRSSTGAAPTQLAAGRSRMVTPVESGGRMHRACRACIAFAGWAPSCVGSRMYRATELAPPEGARWLPGTVVDKGTKPSPEGSNFSHKSGRLSHKSAMPTGTSLAHSAPVKCVLSLPDAAADAAPSSIHIAAGPMQAAVDRRKAFPGQLDWLHARSGSRRADTVGQGLAPRTFVGATADGPA